MMSLGLAFRGADLLCLSSKPSLGWRVISGIPTGLAKGRTSKKLGITPTPRAAVLAQTREKLRKRDHNVLWEKGKGK